MLTTGCLLVNPPDRLTIYLVNVSLWDVVEFNVFNRATLEYDHVLSAPVPPNTMAVVSLPADTYASDSGEIQLLIPGHLEQTITRVKLGPAPVGFAVYQCNDIAFGVKIFQVVDRSKNLLTALD
jgi:hypothetical protein